MSRSKCEFSTLQRSFYIRCSVMTSVATVLEALGPSHLLRHKPLASLGLMVITRPGISGQRRTRSSVWPLLSNKHSDVGSHNCKPGIRPVQSIRFHHSAGITSVIAILIVMNFLVLVGFIQIICVQGISVQHCPEQLNKYSDYLPLR